MAEAPSFCSGDSPSFRVDQADELSDIVREQGKTGPLGER